MKFVSLRSLKIAESLLKSQKPGAVAFNHTCNIHLTAFNSLVSKEFEDAKTKLSTLKEDPGNDVKLKLYALFKQATVGPCNAKKPSMVDFVGRAKWTAWSELKISQTEAEKQYIDLINELLKSDAPTPGDDQTPKPTGKYEAILTSIEHNNIYKIVLNRPTKLNAITVQMYRELIQALKEADADPNVLAVVMTGAGSYYCSGNDLTNFNTKEALADIRKASKAGGDLLEEFVNAFVDFSKPLIGAINGPAVGISVTLLGLFDVVLATDKATFMAPFTRIAQSPEACSTYTFPRMMGNIKAAEFLMFNRKLNAKEALERNMLTEVIPDSDFQRVLAERIESISKLPKESLLESRKVLRDSEKETLRKVNKKEVDVLVERWSSQEFVRVMMDFWKKK